MKNNEINFIYIIDLLKKRWWAIAIAALVGTTAAFCYSVFMVQPMYNSSAMLYVDPKIGDQGYSVAAEAQSLNLASNIMETYIQLLETNDFMKKVSEALDNEYSAKDLKRAVRFYKEGTTKNLYMDVVTSDPDASLHIANVVSNLVPEWIIGITDASVVSVADQPQLPSRAYNDYTARNTVIGFLAGIAIMVGTLILVDMFDIRIKSEEDLINRYDIPVLGSIPNFEKIYKNKPQAKIGGKVTAQSK